MENVGGYGCRQCVCNTKRDKNKQTRPIPTVEARVSPLLDGSRLLFLALNYGTWVASGVGRILALCSGSWAGEAGTRPGPPGLGREAR